MNLYLVQVALLYIHALVGLSDGARYPFRDGSSIVNVIDYGAVGDGVNDDTQVFLQAWNVVCQTPGDKPPTLRVPQGTTLLLSPITFSGPCKSAVHVQIDGNIVAPSTRAGWQNCDLNTWIVFTQINNLSIDGPGVIDGQGSIWSQSYLASDDINSNLQDGGLCNRPQALSFRHCNGLRMGGVTLSNSPGVHMEIENGDDVIIQNIKIQSPKERAWTDGIDLRYSSHVQIHDSDIASGDDCIAIGPGSSWINITGVNCGPGHGISIGSLGKDGGNATVEQVHVQHCTFTNTLSAARIKTWQGGSGYARNIVYEDIPLTNVDYPIDIDQFYCPGQSCPTKPSAVEDSIVTFRGFHGTTRTGGAISLNCSSTVACTGITLENIDITSTNPRTPAIAFCNNAKGTEVSVSPQVPCLQH